MPPPNSEAPPNAARGRRSRVTSPYYDPRNLVDGFMPEGTGANAVQVYFERHPAATYKLTMNQQKDICATVTDLDLWRKVIKEWDLAGWSAANLGGMIECYIEPDRLPSNRHKPKKNNRSPKGQFTNGATEQSAAETTIDYDFYSKLGTASP